MVDGVILIMGNSLKKAAIFVASFVLSASVMMCSGCGFNFDTVILSETDPPDMVLENFFEALKSRDYERCGNYLAENENFMITDNTGYSFVNILTDKAMSYLDYSQTDACNINNVEASCKIRVTALNIGKLSECVRENFVDLEYEYLVEHDKRSIDAQQDKQDIGNIMNIAIEKYAGTAGTIQHQVTVNFDFVNDQWKIRLDSDLVEAIFGDDVNE